MHPRRPRILPTLFLALSATAAVDARTAEREPSPAELGRQLIHHLGCPGCHVLADPEFADYPRPGPDLRSIAAKTTPGWTLEWLLAPRALRPTTSMPQFFDDDGRGEARDIVAFLWQRSESGEHPPPPAGDGGRGEKLFYAVGCSGCHLRDGGARREDFAEPYRLHGPNLAGLGAKVEAGWLYAWLRDPKSLDPGTPMPDLRLSEQEAADLTAFLLADAKPGVPDAELDGADTDAGRDAIELYGCYGCHRIAGFEDAGPHAGELASAAGFAGHGIAGLPDFGLAERELAAIGAALADGARSEDPALVAGRRLVARYNCRGCHLIEDRGHAIEATIDDPGMLPPNLRGQGSRVQPDWLAAYLSHPAAMRLRAWLTVRMPEFGFDDDEVATAVAYFAALEAAEHRDLALAPAAPATARSLALGREAFDLMPCGQCHPTGVEAEEAAGLAAASAYDIAHLAPPLDIANQRLRYGWIHRWLEDPQQWLPGTKMPSFFLRSSSGALQSPFAGAIDSPLFADTKTRMMEHFESEDELAAFLADADAVISAIADYVWSLEEGSGSR